MNMPLVKGLALGAVGLAALVQVYFGVLLAPLSKREARARETLADLQPKIESMQTLLRTKGSLEELAPQATAELDKLRATVPEGEPLAWFPPRLMRVLRKQGVPRASIRLNSKALDSEFVGFDRLGWTIDIPQTGFAALGAAIAEIENNEPLLEIESLRVEASPADPEFQLATLMAQGLVTK